MTSPHVLVPVEPRETAWLIEWPANRQQPVRYWHPTEGHVIDPNHAVRFCRREDAEAMLKREHLFGGARAIEHIWTMLSARPAVEGDVEGVARLIAPEAFYAVHQWMDRLYLSEHEAHREVDRWDSGRQAALTKARAILSYLGGHHE